VIYPFVVMVNTSLKTMQEIRKAETSFLPEKPIWDNYIEALSKGEWLRYFFNSIYLTSLAVVISLVINSLAGFAFARLKFRFRDTLFIITLIGIMIPPQVTILPVFVMLRYMPLCGGNNILGRGGVGLLNSHLGVLLPYIAGSFGVFLFRQFFMTFPSALDDAAKIDGLNRLQTFMKIYVPLSQPVFATLIVLKATHTWNDYIWPLVIINSDKLYTVQLALSKFRDDMSIEWNYLMAATTVIALPLIICFLTFQKYFVQGIVTTGIKG
jgi:multiple sugar transport system permease protein